MNKKQILNLLRSVACMILVCVMLSGCTFSFRIPGKNKGEQSEIVLSETIEQKGDPTFETITEYYDDIFITDPGKWNSLVGSQPSVENLSNYYFDENKIDTSAVGGTDVRTQDYIRGMGRTLYHATEGWNRSATTIALDDANLRELNVTSLRTWGGSTSITDSVKKFTGGFAGVDVLGNTVYEDNTAGTVLFAKQNAAKLILNEWKSILTPDIIDRSTILLIGNEYRVYNKNGSGKYAFSGYDKDTLELFRSVWLKGRFNNIKTLNSLCGTNYKSFNEVVPTENGNKLVFYEFWLFQRSNFKDLFSTVVNEMRSSKGGLWGYAGICAANDPLGNNLYIDCFDYNTQNLYENWWKDISGFIFQLDNLAAWNNDVPVVITETGVINGTTSESEAAAARKYKQILNILYMRPRVAGSYIFDYTSSNKDYILNNDTWGMVKPDRTRYQSFDAVAEVYSNFKYLDTIYNGASNTPLVAISNQATDAMLDKATAPESIAKVLYAHGVPIQVVPSDNAARFKNLEETKLIFNDLVTYEEPDGSNDVAKAISAYLKNGGKVLRLTDSGPKSLYGISNDFTAKNANALSSEFSGLTVESTASKDYEGMWEVLGRFIHGDFVAGKVKTEKGKINENAVRVLEAKGANNSGIGDPTYDLNEQKVYKNGRMYLCVVNSGENPVDKVDITIGVNNGVIMNLNPQLVRGDSNVSLTKPARAIIPSYVTAEESKIAYGTVTINNLDTYAYIDLGVAINK